MPSYSMMSKDNNSALGSAIYGRETEIGYKNLTSLLLLIGGVTWIIHYLLQIVFGAYATHALSLEISFVFVVGLVFSAALVCLNTGLIRLSYLLREKSAGWSYAGMAFASIALAGTMAGVLVNVLAGGHVGILGAIGVVGSCVSATLLAIGALRSKSLPFSHAVLLLLIGVFTFPLIIFLPMPLHIPYYFKDELPFAVSGFAWLVFSILHKEPAKKKNKPYCIG